MKINNTGNFKPITSEKKLSPEKEGKPAVSDEVNIGGSKETAKPHKKWLFMNYIAADCNLKDFQLRNIDSQEKVGSDENTHIVAYVDVGHEPNPMDKTWSGARSYYVTKDSEEGQINSEVISHYGNNVDMSSPATLTKFIVDAMEKFPSDHVALVFNDHGGGFTGAMADDSDGDFMSVPQLRKGLADAEKITGKKIDVIGFDACLMAEAEVAYELKDNANILLASEESEGGPGWAYNEMLGEHRGTAIGVLQEALKKRIDVSPEEFAKIIVKINEKYQKYIPTFSATDLTKMDGLAKSINDFAEAILRSDEKEEVKQAIVRTQHYGGGDVPYSELHDLHHLAEHVSKRVKDKNLKKAADNVQKAVGEAVIANEATKYTYGNSKGLSIYSPIYYVDDKFDYGYEDLQFNKDTKWQEAMLEVAHPNREGRAGEVSPTHIPKVWPDGSPRKSKGE